MVGVGASEPVARSWPRRLVQGRLWPRRQHRLSGSYEQIFGVIEQISARVDRLQQAQANEPRPLGMRPRSAAGRSHLGMLLVLLFAAP